ncbi:hypothetical protein [Lacipirellula sp.]|uniref:hypothetical protein n=1 Tax=Lacipirellula sp. TaxID=2691419 RepID=UPI003D0BC1F3
MGYYKRASGDGASSTPAVSFGKSDSKRKIRIALTGLVELDRQLQELANETNARGINKTMRRLCREAVKQIVKPAVLELMPWDTGFLESQLTVRATRRSRTSVGYRIGFPDDSLFAGDTYYGGFIEFGWDHFGGVHVEADSFLRRALYPNQDRIVAFVREGMRAWLAELNAQT